jgi:hypothetical protein
MDLRDTQSIMDTIVRLAARPYSPPLSRIGLGSLGCEDTRVSRCAFPLSRSTHISSCPAGPPVTSFLRHRGHRLYTHKFCRSDNPTNATGTIPSPLNPGLYVPFAAPTCPPSVQASERSLTLASCRRSSRLRSIPRQRIRLCLGWRGVECSTVEQQQ